MKPRQSFLYGTMILAMGTVIVKLVGALFKVPLANLLGGVGMSYFNVAYDLYYPLYALFVSGVPIAVSKLVSESLAQGRCRDARRLLRVAICLFAGAGLLGSLVMYAGAGWFANLVNNPSAKYAVRCLSPALFCGCLLAVFRGYSQGHQDMAPTAISQMIEAVAKLVFGLTFTYSISWIGLHQYAQEGVVFGLACDSEQQASLLVLPFAAAGAILGVTVSTLCGTFYMALCHRSGRRISREQWEAAPPAASTGALMHRLVHLAVPVCIAAVISNLTSFIDLISVMNRLNKAIYQNPEIVLGMYQGAIPEGIGLEQLGSYLYGCYSGLTVPVYNLVPSLTTVIGVSLLPAVAAAWATHNRVQLERNAASALRLAAMIAIPAGLGIAVMATPVLELLYFSKPMEIAAISPALHLMGLSAVFVAISLPVNAILQAVGQATVPMRLLFFGGLLKLALNYMLVAIPQLNIHAAPVGTMACYTLVLLGGLWSLVHTTGLKLPFIPVFGKPLFAGICCALTAHFSFGWLSKWLPSQVSTLVAIGCGGVVYVFLILITRTITKQDIFLLPQGEKFAQILEKHSFLG